MIEQSELLKKDVIDDMMMLIRIGLDEQTTFSMDQTPELGVHSRPLLEQQDLWDLIHMSKYMREQLYQFHPAAQYRWYDRIIDPPEIEKYDPKEGF